MCGRFYVGGDFRDKMDELMKSEGIAPAEPVYGEAGPKFDYGGVR